jgi:hypothetical protein
MTWKHHALVVALAAAAGAAVWPARHRTDAIVITLAVITVAAMVLASPLSRRIIALLLIPLYYWVTGFVVPLSLVSQPGIEMSGWDGPLRLTLTTLPVIALLCVAAAALRRSAHRLSRPPVS